MKIITTSFYNYNKNSLEQSKQSNASTSFGSLFRFSSYVDCKGQHRQTQNTTGKREDLDYDEIMADESVDESSTRIISISSRD